MYMILMLVYLVAGFAPITYTLLKWRTVQKTVARDEAEKWLERWFTISVAVILADVISLAAVIVYLHYFTEMLWFENLNFSLRFWIVIAAKLKWFFIGAGVSFLATFLTLRGLFSTLIKSNGKIVALIVSLAVSVLLGLGAGSVWDTILVFLNQSQSTTVDPIFGKSISFYLFSLPLYQTAVSWMFWQVALLLVAVLVMAVVTWPSRKENVLSAVRSRVLTLFALTLFTLSASWYLKIYALMYSKWGAVVGAGYVDVNWRVFGYKTGALILTVSGMLLLVAAFSQNFGIKLFALEVKSVGYKTTWKTLIFPVAFILSLSTITWAVPYAVQIYKVSPNEITLEKPYIMHNMKYTPQAYGLESGKMEEREYPVKKRITSAVLEQNKSTMDNIRLWDWSILLDFLKQKQEMRQYYKFHDVDIDRYLINGEYRQVMLTVRELNKNQLDDKSKEWVPKRLKFTHGYGVVMAPVNEFVGKGEPNLIIKNIPPDTTIASLKISRPEIYYGELTNDYVFTNTTEEEFDYPSGSANVNSTYAGKGGIKLDSFWRKFAFGWTHDGHRILLSSYVTPESKIMFRNNIIDRVSEIAPFLKYDDDPYAVIDSAGRIKWIIDAYTVSDRYPYSEKYQGQVGYFHGNNYIRNSVKVVVDAYDGDVNFYVVDGSDILIQTYSKMFPGMFKVAAEMPKDLVAHLRYPEDLLTVQAEAYNIYHMKNVDVFYQREDVWEFATEKYRKDFQVISPYYVMLQFPKEEKAEFIQMIPFTPKGKNVLIGWIAGKCDMPNYGKLTVFKFPKGEEVLGTRQIEARIDQDKVMSQEMNLWGNDNGSEVVRGNLLVIPLFEKNDLYLLYAEPIYLQATGSAMPELKKIALADQEEIVWDDTFRQALYNLIGQARAKAGSSTDSGEILSLESLIFRAGQDFDDYQELAGKGKMSQAGAKLDSLKSVLKALEDKVK